MVACVNFFSCTLGWLKEKNFYIFFIKPRAVFFVHACLLLAAGFGMRRKASEFIAYLLGCCVFFSLGVLLGLEKTAVDAAERKNKIAVFPASLSFVVRGTNWKKQSQHCNAHYHLG